MPTLAQQIAAVRLRKSPEQIARSIADGRRRQAAFRAKVTTDRAPGSVMDASFMKQLEARRAAVDAGAAARRPDPHLRIAALRAEGKLPPVEGEDHDRPEYATTYSPRDALQRLLGQAPAPDRVAYEPTPEEILGDEALPKPTAPAAPKVADDNCPPAGEVLGGGVSVDATGATPEATATAEPSPYLPGDLTADELAEIDRLNPRRPVAASHAAAAPVARPSRPVHTASKRQRGR